MNVHPNLIDLIGNTPMVRLKNFKPSRDIEILAKLEGFNPSGSLKDRIVKSIIENGEKEGKLNKRKIIVEASSGNTGISLAMFGAVKGYRVKIFMPENKSIERRKMIKYWGAELVLTPADVPHSHIKAVESLLESDPESYYYLNQNGDSKNVEAHYSGTGEEILKQTGGDISAVVAGLGTGGTLMGIAKRLKKYSDKIKVIAVEPEKPESKIEGLLHLNGSYIPPILEMDYIDENIRVPDDKAFEFTKKISMLEGLFVGISSGAVLYAALRISNKIKKGNIVVVFADRGDRYISTS
ncbi:MAG: PLP-dependent cysteine synthase family protein [Acidobacteriota bacterium]